MTDTTRPRFDLLIEPWIPCELPDGARVELGIRDVLHRAHELAAVHDESPLVTAVLHRLLLAILDRALQPKNRDDWLALWRAERLPVEPIDAYLDRWKERFDLFHPERPFMQVAKLDEKLRAERGKDAERTAAWRMVMESSSCGGHIAVFEPMPADAALSPQAAARGLLAFQLYTSGGRIQNEAESWTGGVMRPGAVATLRGSTLRESLVLNLVARSSRAPDDVPPWERARDVERLTRPAAGPIDLLLWPSRRVLLYPDAAARVEDVLTAAGERTTGEVADPQMAYFVRNPKNPPVALRFDPDRGAWRDSTALIDASTGGGAFQRPHAITQMAELILAGRVPRAQRLALELRGMSTDKAIIRLSRAERMPVSARMLTDSDRVATLKSALELAEAVGTDLERKALFVLCERALAPTDREAHKNDVSSLRDALGTMAQYWGALGQAFEPWLLALGDADDPDTALPAWKDATRRAAREAFRDACARLGTTARAFQAAAQAEGTLAKLLSEHLGPARTDAPAPTAGATP
ncbi:MAG: type I-E CRISPR-associated protein Cse1/CasA [Deltaproteobacteria bacterium]|nr:type I-E CRISPR-associated protein Cse1/CasA [Deltaproteobacteria bacterium]